MGTRGAYGFRHKEKDIVSYNHFDSYPSGLGNKVANFLNMFTNVEDLQKVAEGIELVNEDSKPTKEQKIECKKFELFNKTVSSQSDGDWYCLLRESQGDLTIYTDGFKYMIDGHKFLADSLFCEWAYIINLDTGELEIYRGFNKDETAPGRYAKVTKEGEYVGVRLVKTIPLDDFFGKDFDMTEIEGEIRTAEEEEM